MHTKWEMVQVDTWRTGALGAASNNSVQILRFAVPGGYIYCLNPGGPVFVPDHRADAILDAISKEDLEKTTLEASNSQPQAD